ncbi:hypothetical protein ACNOYE_32800 [Nannocystaceae bacterium ST9]
MAELIADPATWPLILCGPILRKVTTTEVHVFVICSEACRVTLKVASEGMNWSSNSISTRAIGLRMHVIVVGLTASLMPGRRYDYDLELEPIAGGPTQTLGRLGLLDGPFALGYAVGRLPSFCLPGDLASLRLVHGSCRLPHGDGWDMMALVDGLIAAHLDDPRERPNQLILTGDQIYADDVAPCMMAMVARLGRELLGWNESIPHGDPPKHLSVMDGLPLGPVRRMVRLGLAPFRTRGEFVHAETELTSDHGDCHLLFFGEFCAMYVMAWSPVPWPAIIPTAEQVVPMPTGEDAMTALSRSTREFIAKANATREHLVRYASTVARVRRALANVPVAMMFDDHEVTDDWNINALWMWAVYTNATSRSVVRHGLLAYALFQDWGSQPDDYRAGMGQSILNALTSSTGDMPPLVSTPSGSLDVVLGLPTASEPLTSIAANARKHWHHRIVGRDHQILLLDTRTWRNFSGPWFRHPGDAAELIDREALHRQMAPALADPDKLLIVVSGTPVIGFDWIEWAQDVVAHQWPNGWTWKDFEAWSSNETGFVHALAALLSAGRVVVLAGDVHYGFAFQAALQRGDDGPRARIVQLNASAFKNYTDDTERLQRATTGLVDLHWKTTLSLESSDEEALQLARRQVLDERESAAKARGALPDELAAIRRSRLALKRSQTMHHPWYEAVFPASPHLRLAVRSALVQLREQGLDGDWRPQALTTGGREWSALLGRGNVGFVRFPSPTGQAPTEVEQSLYFFMDDGPSLPGSVHSVQARAPLAAPTDGEFDHG